jgi:2'-5' RNA ligase
MGNESAIILPVPEVEPIVGRWRQQYDAAARLGVPAHVTLLYPFLPALAAIAEIESLRTVCASIEAFPFCFTEVRRFPSTVYLCPDKSETLAQVTRTFVRTWPDCIPYGGAHPDIVPHLTVADKVSLETSGAVETSLWRYLPVRCVAKEVWLMTSDEAGIWSTTACVPFTPMRE